MKEIKLNKNLIEYIIIVLLSVIICFGFIKMHYTTDTYKIVNDGYMNYAVNWSLKDGRPFMYLILLFCNLLNISIEFLSGFITLVSIAISCLTVLIIKNMLINVKSDSTIKDEIIILILSYLSIFNFMFIETIYFLETTIISLSILCFTLAAKQLFYEKRLYKLKTIIIVVLGIMFYQGTLSYFVALSCSLLIIKNKKINKDFILKVLLVVLACIIAVLINLATVKVICKFINVEQTRFDVNLNAIKENIVYIINNIKYVFVSTCGLLKEKIYIISLCCIIAIILFRKINESSNYLKTLLDIILICVFTILPCFLIQITSITSFDCGRMYVAIGALPAILIIYDYVVFGFKNEILLNTVIAILCLWFIFNSINYIEKINEVRLRNKLEFMLCQDVAKYCNENNLELIKAYIIPIRDKRNKVYFQNINSKNKMTINEVRGRQSAICVFNISTNSNLIEIDEDKEINEAYKEKVNDGEKGINDTGIMYINDTLVFPVYIW